MIDLYLVGDNIIYTDKNKMQRSARIVKIPRYQNKELYELSNNTTVELKTNGYFVEVD